MFILPPIDPGIELVVASRGMSKGVQQTVGEPQVLPKVYIQAGDIQIGSQWKNVTSTSARGEAAAFVNVNRKVGRFQITAGAAYKFQTGVTGTPDSDSFEFTGGVSRKFGKLSVKLTGIYSPDDLGSAKRSLYLEAGPSLDLGKTLRLSANLGRRTRAGGVDYVSMNMGATKTVFRAFSVDLRYYRTNRAELGQIYKSRLVAAGRWSF